MIIFFFLIRPGMVYLSIVIHPVFERGPARPAVWGRQAARHRFSGLEQRNGSKSPPGFTQSSAERELASQRLNIIIQALVIKQLGKHPPNSHVGQGSIDTTAAQQWALPQLPCQCGSGAQQGAPVASSYVLQHWEGFFLQVLSPKCTCDN